MSTEEPGKLTPALRNFGKALEAAGVLDGEAMLDVLKALREYGEECFLEGYARALSSTLAASHTRDLTELQYWIKDAGMAVIAKQLTDEFFAEGGAAE